MGTYLAEMLQEHDCIFVMLSGNLALATISRQEYPVVMCLVSVFRYRMNAFWSCFPLV